LYSGSIALTIATVAALGVGCAHGSRHTSSAAAAGTRTSVERTTRPRSSSQAITIEELATVSATTAYEVVLQLRPGFLRRIPGTEPVVYIDGLAAGSTSTLSMIPVRVIAEIRYMRPSETMVDHGSVHPGGVIVVRTRR
jgi:hypothetical protein